MIYLINRIQSSGMHIPVFAILLSALVTFAGGCAPDAPLPSYAMYDVSYGPDPQNTIDISLPGGRTRATPVVILIHGGAWISGDKSDFTFLREYLSSRGFAAFSANYRLARITGTGFTNILDDMDKVIAFVREKSGEWTFSRDVIFLAGHSAGGHIALLYAFTRDSRGSIRGVISYCGPTDLTDPELKMSFDLMQKNETPAGEKPFDLIGFMTGPDPAMRAAYSPKFMVKNIPVLLFSGKEDKVIPWRQSGDLHADMKKAGYDSTLYVYPDMKHDITPYYEKIMKITERWMRERIKG